ncbi:MAG: aspartate aminotransferase family protein [Flavobacterium sp.]|nr:MAG: aspartate aminotransferase family protein [Flavobacterium sp.]
MNSWKKSSQQDSGLKIRMALKENVNFSTDRAMGYPVSKLDGKVFFDAPFLKDAPVLEAYVSNPNHIGCHTLGTSEAPFRGTQALEREVIGIVASTIFNAQDDQFDGYVASGGTEANIQALWMYRNFFLTKPKAKLSEIAIVTSEDTHYSIAKGSNLLMTDWIKVPVDFNSRKPSAAKYEKLLQEAIANGKKYFIVVANMGTTMFGSVDDPSVYTNSLKKRKLPFFVHVDAAYGGFIYPFLSASNNLDFQNPDISSIAVDAHKMLQAPYGTGIFVCRKNLIENVLTSEAEYVEGFDLTLSGSRSGANVIAVWMILKTYGKDGWFEKIKILQMRTDWLCQQLDRLEIGYFREPNMNIVAVHSACIPEAIAQKYRLVPQKHNDSNQWYKIVLMEHVEVEYLNELLTEIAGAGALKPAPC